MNAIRSYLSRASARLSRLGKDPQTDWYFALGAFALALGVVVALDAYFAFDVTQVAEETQAETRKAITLDRDALSEEAKRIREESQTKAPIPEAALRDPSL
ncbi:MAG: hypothetical protein HZA81_03300 [Candidatus Taylorbacteria bacterium]|nr:hypothetical protein [Candidatus Taylorbacteria bacterium]